jgi:hypothetical protein
MTLPALGFRTRPVSGRQPLYYEDAMAILLQQLSPMQTLPGQFSHMDEQFENLQKEAAEPFPPSALLEHLEASRKTVTR